VRVANTAAKVARDTDVEEIDVEDQYARVYKTTSSMRSTAKKGSFGDVDGD
jgi:hypothetical protein